MVDTTTNENTTQSSVEKIDLLDQYKVWFRSLFLRAYYFINYGEEIADIKAMTNGVDLDMNEMRAWILSGLIEGFKDFEENVYVKTEEFTNFKGIIEGLEIVAKVDNVDDSKSWYHDLFGSLNSFFEKKEIPKDGEDGSLSAEEVNTPVPKGKIEGVSASSKNDRKEEISGGPTLGGDQ